MLSEKDRKKRQCFARQAIQKYDRKFWTDDALLYLDGVSFIHKRNPYRDALMPRGRTWRRSNEGLKYTTKGSKSLPEGGRLHLLVGVGFTNNVVIAEEYRKFNGELFTRFVHKSLHSTIIDCAISKEKRSLFF